MSYSDIFHAMLKGGLTKSARDEVGAVCAAVVKQKCGKEGITFGSLTPPIDSALADRGYLNLPDLLAPGECKQIVSDFDCKRVRYPVNGVDATNGEAFAPWASAIPPQTRFAHYDFAEVVSHPLLRQLIANPGLIDQASQYLGCPATVSIVDLWWSYPSDHELGGMQYWHHDRGDFRSLNLFVYLTDVDPMSGPHMFIERSHEYRHLVDKCDDRRFAAWLEQHRKSDEDVDRWLSGHSQILFQGPAGKSFWEDTRGIHKGLPPITKPRLAFEIVYTVIPKFDHPTPIPRPGKPDPLTKYSTRYIYDWKE